MESRGEADQGVRVELDRDHVATVSFSRPPLNFFSVALLTDIADAFESLNENLDCRAIVLRSEGKHFCAGADFSEDDSLGDATAEEQNPLYVQAVRLAGGEIPIVAAIQGAAIGGGLGLALVADFRVATPESRLAANFARLGLHHGFGLSETLPDLVGSQRALELLYTGRRIDGAEAKQLGLVDRLVEADGLDAAAHAFAAEIAESAPLALRAIRSTMRGDLPRRIAAATLREHRAQVELRATADFAEGVAAYAERRPADFRAR